MFAVDSASDVTSSVETAAFDKLTQPGWYECTGCGEWVSSQTMRQEAVSTPCLYKDCPEPTGVECPGCHRTYNALYRVCADPDCGKRLPQAQCKSCKRHWEWRVKCDECGRSTTVGMLVPSRNRNCEPVLRVAYQTPYNPAP